MGNSNSKKGDTCDKTKEELDKKMEDMVKKSLQSLSLTFDNIPTDYLDEVGKRFTSKDPKAKYRAGDKSDRLWFSERWGYEKGHIRIVAFNAPALLAFRGRLSSDTGNELNRDTFSTPVSGGSIDILSALLFMAHDSCVLAEKLEKEAEKKSEEAMKTIAKMIDDWVSSDLYVPIHSTVKAFLSALGVRTSPEDVKNTIISYIADSATALSKSKLSKGLGAGAIASAVLTLLAGGTGIALVSTGALSAGALTTVLSAGGVAAAAAPPLIPIVIIGAALAGIGGIIAFSVTSEKMYKASEASARKSIELMRVANYSLMFSQIRDALLNQRQLVQNSNILLLAFDDLQDVENADTYRLFRTRADLLEKEEFKNKGAFAQFIPLERNPDLKGVATFAPKFGSFKNKDGLDIFSYFQKFPGWFQTFCQQHQKDKSIFLK